MTSIDEKRVYGERDGATEAYVASSAGIVRVRVSGDAVGEFGLVERAAARDVAAGTDAVAVATDEDVLVRSPATGATADGADDETAGGDEDTASSFEPTGFGPAVAVGVRGERLLAADADGRVAVADSIADVTGKAGWNDLESPADLEVRAIDGDLLATPEGVYRRYEGRLDHAGLADVRDVSAPGVPLAATAEGLYKLGNGWMVELEDHVETVAADPLSEPGRLRRAHAVSGLELYEYAVEESADGASAEEPAGSATADEPAGSATAEWHRIDSTSVPIVDLAYGESTYAVTERGTFLVESEDGWRTRRLGVGGVSGLAVPLSRPTDE